jgi:hypothetical protein
LKHRFIDFTKVSSHHVQKADYEFSGPFAYLKRNFRDLVNVAFLDAHDVENDFEWPFDTMTHCIMEFPKIAF